MTVVAVGGEAVVGDKFTTETWVTALVGGAETAIVTVTGGSMGLQVVHGGGGGISLPDPSSPTLPSMFTTAYVGRGEAGALCRSGFVASNGRAMANGA